MIENLIKARLVYDGSDSPPAIPEEMGTPKENQFQGKPKEQLAELAGRICYDSLGQGRSSAEYHRHIHEVGHLSVYEHTPITVEFPAEEDIDVMRYALVCANRPGVFFRWEHALSGGYSVRVTANFRAILEWGEWSSENRLLTEKAKRISVLVGNTLMLRARDVAPMICPLVQQPYLESTRLVHPKHPEEAWVTLYLSGSRGFSHEQVRHRYAMSQRSTRYVDESGSPYVMHPLVSAYLEDVDEQTEAEFRSLLDENKADCGETYDRIVAALQPWVLKKNPGISKLGARKQARGAARGFLGNALHTEMLFSSSLRGWISMLRQRASPFADAEIRELYARETASVIEALWSSKYSDFFSGLEIQESPDGIGTVVVLVRDLVEEASGDPR